MQTNERWTYSVKEAARILGLSKNAAYQACLRDEIPNLKIGRRILIPRAQLERLLLGNSEAKEVRDG